jgi:hypothetical protein
LSYPYLAFLVGGGSDMEKLAVQLLVDDKIVRIATGHNGLNLRTVVWYISEFKGKGCYSYSG